MSLNGLDASEVNEAYQSALGEGGGWFLLQYLTRDEVGLLKRGSGGVVDIRDSITHHDEQSPLYGFVHYRRRKVILKYVPEGTSRLLQAASIKSSSDSLRQRGLSEIAEDVEHQPPEAEVGSESKTGDTPSGAPSLQARPERTDSLSNTLAAAPLPVHEQRKPHSPPRRIRNTDKALPPTPREANDFKATTRNALEDTFLESRPSIEGRPSIQSTRPSIRSMRTSYEYRPKVKLGPRPSMESSSHMHSLDREIDIRPISTLPSGVRLPARDQAPGRLKSANGPTSIAETSEVPLPSPKPILPATVPGKVMLPSSNALPKQLQPAECKTSAMTPEKRRLKKALELRQKQLAARNAQHNLEKKEVSQRHLAQPSSDHIKCESLTATLPDISPADDGTTDALQERIDALNEDPDIVHVGPQNLGKDVQESFEVSPISIPEVSDGPSTQASSITDEDETPTKPEPATEDKRLDDYLVSTSVVEQPNENHAALREPQTPQSQGRVLTSELPFINEPRTEPSAADIAPHEQQEDAGSQIMSLNSPYSRSTLGSDDADPGESFALASPGSDPPSPLFIRRSSSSKSINIGIDGIKPHEIPLPPIGEEEEISLSPRRKAFTDCSASHSHVEDEERHHHAPVQVQEEEEGLRETRSSMAESFIEQRERRTRRHGLINPMKRVSSPDYSDEQFLSDDSFMEELKSATVQEAKPISVSKSPIMPVFPRSVSESKSTDELRPASAGSRLNRPKRQDDHQPMMPKLPDLFSARSASASHAPLLEAQLSPTTFKKSGVSSGISQRIKALEQLSSRPTSPASQLPSPSATPGITPTSTSRRKPSFRASQAAVEIAKAGSQKANTSPAMPFSPKSHSLDRSPQNIGDNVVRIDVATKSGKARPESISVTARIIRGSKNKVPELSEDPSKPGIVDLYPSPLTVEHQSMRPTTPLSPLMPPKPSYARSISSTSTTQRSDPLMGPRRDSISSRLSSTPSRRGSESELPRSMSDTSIHSIVNLDGSKEERKESRKSRLFKRMSNISAASRRSIASALSPVRKDIKEEPIVEHHEPSRETLQALAVEIGDVNIQFPDTLLWKRRHMKVDENGLLVLSASKADNNSKVIPKRYPFTEFHPPYLPDQDQQELPNSVILDFRDGNTLQCACENPYTQTEVFRALKQAHHKYNTTP
ncbi:MAG: hypothetical protein LQ343_006413 [Gyalolechia ehrenbergii]|nr:MAG: hypothetical protein LQ343_006413 [Gyalolechia ehrenbergii]